ncbi:MAG: hypothetical protein HQK65_12265 [Desulfamplus sp.]|nr:hypothetical protein [Desulfamplus sp.]
MVKTKELIPISHCCNLIAIYKKRSEYFELKSRLDKIENKYLELNSILSEANKSVNSNLFHLFQRIVSLNISLGIIETKGKKANEKRNKNDKPLNIEDGTNVDNKYLFRQCLLNIHRGGFWSDDNLKSRLSEAYNQGNREALLKCYFESTDRFGDEAHLKLKNFDSDKQKNFFEQNHFNLSLFCHYAELRIERYEKLISEIVEKPIYKQYLLGEKVFMTFIEKIKGQLFQEIGQKEERLALLKNQALLNSKK